MIKRMNKKGAVIWNQFLPLLVGIVVVVLVILLATGAFGKFGDLIDKASSIEITALACEGYASADRESSYCNLFQKVDLGGVKQYVTCEYLDKTDIPEISFEKWSGECTSNQDTLATNRCKTLKDNEIVNGRPCYHSGADTNWGTSKEHLKSCKAKDEENNVNKVACEAIKTKSGESGCDTNSDKCEWKEK